MAQQIVGLALGGSNAEAGDLYLERRLSPSWLSARRKAKQRSPDALVRTIEREIIPRMVLARRGERNQSGEIIVEPDLFSGGGIAHFARSVTAADVCGAVAYLDMLRSGGASLQSIFLDLLAPTARHLGAQWEADLIEFGEVTIGVGRLQLLMHELERAFPYEMGYPADSRRALIVSADGEQHTFGTLMIVEFLCRAGWDVWYRQAPSDTELAHVVRDNWFAVAGFSAGSDRRLKTLSSQIRLMRQTSRNHRIGVMVGGPIFAGRPELIAMVGADATAIDAGQIASQARRLVTMMAADR